MLDFLTALGLVLVIEGLLYAIAPASMKAAIIQLLKAPDNQLRIGGIVALGLGVGLIWIIRSGL